eukprot:15366687-Ditylum_brightwellii.AAC.1
MAQQRKPPNSQTSGSGLVERKLQSQINPPKSRTSGSVLVEKKLQSGHCLKMVGTIGSESENLHAGSNSFTSPTTQPPGSDDEESSQSGPPYSEDSGPYLESDPDEEDSNMTATDMDDDSVQESEPGGRDDDDVNLVPSLPELDQEGNKMEEEEEVEVHEENDISEVSPSDTLKGSKVQEERGQESKDNLEGGGNDNTGLEVYGKDDNLVSSLPELDQEGNKMEEEKEVEVREERGQESKDNLEGDGNDDAGSEVYGKDSKEISDSSEGSIHDISNVSPSIVMVKAGGMQRNSSKVSKRDNLKVSQSKSHAKGGKQKAKQGVPQVEVILVIYCPALVSMTQTCPLPTWRERKRKHKLGRE